jgi:UDP-N-acetylmuramoyl-L-alanyl-D-glutamate--2,6-diaminopimelate ligase
MYTPPSLAEFWPEIAGLGLRGVTADSRAVTPGMLFAALPGAQVDGRNFIPEAVRRGAAAVLAPTGTLWPAGVPMVPLFTDPQPRRRFALATTALAGAQPDVVVAVTGTNGKTSTVDFYRQLATLQGKRAASLGTLGLHAPGFPAGPGLTTPDPVALAAMLAALARGGVEHAAMEASSHGLDQFRLDGVRLAAGAFTNLTRDHLDYHGSMAAYRTAKLRLFGELLPEGAAAVASTALDAGTLAALRAIATRRRLTLLEVGEGGATIDLLRAVPLPDGQALTLRCEGITEEIEIRLPGRFQADNALVAAALAGATGLSEALHHLPGLRGVRGRMELAARLDNGAGIYVDYAHTPDALERLLMALRPHATGRLIVAFGAGGDRDRGKRPLMGAAAGRLADIAIVTDDNPRGEAPAAIRAEVRAGCPEARDIGDRAEAIAVGLSLLGPGDVLVVAGKGHEQGQTIGGHTLPFDDVATVRRLAGVA